jgi:DnaJ-class molecular chaperone
MPTSPVRSGKEPAEGSRETIEHELKRTGKGSAAVDRGRGAARGDEAAPGTPGTGEDVCPECRGSGKLGARPCPNCNGSGRIVKAIGGA